MILSDHSSWSTSFNWLVSWHRRVFKQIFKGVEVGALKRPFQKLNASLLFPLKNKLWCSFGIIVLLEQLILHKFQRYSCWFNLGSPPSPLFYPLCAIYQYHLQQNSHRTWCYCHRAWPFLFTPSNISLIEDWGQHFNLFLIWPYDFSPECIWLVSVGNCKFQSSLKVLVLEQGLLYW